MCEEGWYVGLGQDGFVWGLGELSENLNRGCNRKEVRETKTLKMGGKLGQVGDALKPPYELWIIWIDYATITWSKWKYFIPFRKYIYSLI